MNHIFSKHTQGNVEIAKSSLGDLAELIRESPTVARIYLCLVAYADKNNDLVTDVKTLSEINSINTEMVKFSLTKLSDNGFIDLSTVKLSHDLEITKFIHNQPLYDVSKGEIWEVMDTEFIPDCKVSGKFNLIHVNEAVTKCSDNDSTNVLIQAKDNLFYDTTVRDSELIWELN